MTWSPSVAKEIVESFKAFCQDCRTDDSAWWGFEESESLLDLIECWLRRDRGVEETGGDFTAYLQAVLIIIDAYEKDPTIVDFKGDATNEPYLPPLRRPIRRLLGLKEWGAAALDEHLYMRVLFETKTAR